MTRLEAGGRRTEARGFHPHRDGPSQTLVIPMPRQRSKRTWLEGGGSPNPLVIRNTGVNAPNTCETRRTHRPTLRSNAGCLKSQRPMSVWPNALSSGHILPPSIDQDFRKKWGTSTRQASARTLARAARQPPTPPLATLTSSLVVLRPCHTFTGKCPASPVH